MLPYKPPMAAAVKPRNLLTKPPSLGATNIWEEAKRVAPEFKEAGNWFLVTGAFVASDFVIHQLMPVAREENTPPWYYSNKLIWTIPGLLLGRLISDYIIKGSTFVRALTIGTTANLVLAGRYIKNYPLDYLIQVGGLHEILLVPLSLLIVGPSPVTGFFEKPKG